MIAQQQQLVMFQLAIINRLWPSTDCRLHARILRWLATPWADFIPSWDWRKWNPYCDFTKLPSDPGKCLDSYQLFSCNYCLFFNSIINVKVFRNGSDTSTSNRCPSISTYREILISTQHSLRFRSIWRGWTRETPWIWHREYSRHRCREFIFSLSQEWRVFYLLHRRFSLIFFFIWTGI